jgi:uncharacterized membrane protein
MSLRVIIKKWYVILICAVICAGGLYYEKSRVVPVAPQTGDITYIRVVKFDQIPTETLKDTSEEIKMGALVKSWPNLSMLTYGMEDNIDMQRLNQKWGSMAQSQKFDWLTQHFRINWIGPGMYELIFQMKKEEVKDAEYIKENHEKLIGVYEDYFQKSAGMVTNDTNLTTVKNFELVEEAGMPTVKQIEKKYAVIGFVLGALVGVVIVMVWDARKRIAQK